MRLKLGAANDTLDVASRVAGLRGRSMVLLDPSLLVDRAGWEGARWCVPRDRGTSTMYLSDLGVPESMDSFLLRAAMLGCLRAQAERLRLMNPHAGTDRGAVRGMRDESAREGRRGTRRRTAMIDRRIQSRS